MKRLTAALLVSLLAFAAPARADNGENVEKARILFNAGAQAYAAGRYEDAVHAFREAHSLTPERATVIFSLAQAERRHYTVVHDPEVLRAAIDHFRRYLALVPEGGRRADAIAALGELEATLSGLRDKAEPDAAPRAPPPARIMVTTNAPDAVISLDGEAHAESPLLEVVGPGRHVVRVSAPGFLDEQRQVVAVEGALVPIEITLRERPSYLALTAPRGAWIAIDGRPQGEAPVPGRIELAPGPHLVTVTQWGHDARAERVVLARGHVTPLAVTLRTSDQRRVSQMLAGGFAAGLVGGAVLALGALRQENIAKRVLADAEVENISATQLEQYNTARESRDALRVASYSVFGLSCALGVAAAATFYFDNPKPPRAPRMVGVQRGSIAILPGGAGVGIGGTF
ncbi:PEGA domain-containing protein [Polyangium aurulentum]|uniref:PEGA domain-containing protein n=1 Tax=Polyangium aurulentum TaxID=2567896 RepID=UPI0010AEA4B3|nr:PEGA domain-containing protein [Polyangium aurulentum]UQA54630.1 PEGA domain-containing protein [Polyangium aurulentum]